MPNETNWHKEFLDLLDEHEAMRRALIAVLLSVGGSVEIKDEVVSSITGKDQIRTEQSETKQSHLVWVEREGGIKH